ncbi:MAG: hypothetical protein AAFV69_10100 [Pseudomonadota bacterium]
MDNGRPLRLPKDRKGSVLLAWSLVIRSAHGLNDNAATKTNLDAARKDLVGQQAQGPD